jgi:branched-chain amino acid transport system permease protein
VRGSAWLPLAALAAALVAVPVLGDSFLAYQVGLYLLYGLVAQGIVLSWGRCGFLPLGQALFFGLGAYLAGGILKAAQAQPGWWLALPLAALLPGLLAYGVARILFARKHDSGPYFALITLALAMLGFQIANQWSSVTGGFNGMGGIPELPGVDRYEHMYGLIAALCLACTAGFVWLDRRPIGILWRAIADNENRLQFFGYATDRLKAAAFGLAGLAGGLAGLLYAPYQGLVTPQTTSFLLSAELVIWTAVGGRRSPSGALLGAVGIGLLSATLREHFVWWEAIVAGVFIVVVLRFPGGLAGALSMLARRIGWRPDEPAWRPSTSALAAPPVRTAGGAVSSPPGADVLSFEGVRARQHGVTILDRLDLRIDTPGVHGLIGPNGAGKTSTFNAMTGRLPVAAGTILWRGRPLVGLTADAVARLGVGRKFQIPSVFPSLTVVDHLRIALWARRARGVDLLRASTQGWGTPLLRRLVAQLPFLEALAAHPAGSLSQGQRQMLELAMTLLPEPQLLLLDEPCAGLSTQETTRQLAVIAETVRALGSTALLIEHDMTAVESLAQQVHVLHQGRLLASGPMAAVQADPDVRRIYAGGRK